MGRSISARFWAVAMAVLLVAVSTSCYGVEAQLAPLVSPVPAASPGFPPISAPKAPVAPPMKTPPAVQQVLEALRTTNFTTAARMIQKYLQDLRKNSTLFLPTDVALAKIRDEDLLGKIFNYHSATPQYSFEQLLGLGIGTQLKTALTNYTLLVTDSSRDNFLVDDVRISFPDVCRSSRGSTLEVSCHGVDSIFNLSKYGFAALPQEPATAPASVPVASPAPTQLSPLNSPPAPPVPPGAAPETEILPPAAAPSASPPTDRSGSIMLSADHRRAEWRIFLTAAIVCVVSAL